MAERSRVFLDTSALFAAVWSDHGGARAILQLGEAGVLSLLVSRQVLKEAEGALKRKAPDAVPLLALLLDQSNITVVKSASSRKVHQLEKAIGHRGDAQIVADAAAADADYLVTHDQDHILGNRRLTKAVPIQIGTPGDFLEWFREQIG